MKTFEKAPVYCKGCGDEIMVIRTDTCYKTVTVDAEPIWIEQASGGELYFTKDGRPVYGFITGDANDDPDANFLEVYIPHNSHCPNNGRAPRKRKRRPSGYR